VSNTLRIITLIPGFVLGLTLHEFSHALVAVRLGDPTARQLGRLSLNPLRHLDLFGSLMLILAGFGWAKPIPVDARYLRSPRRDMAMIALAGPLSNLVLAVVLAMMLRLVLAAGGTSSSSVLILLLVQAVWINLVLAVFNLIPLPPLDGSRIVAGVVPEQWNRGYDQLERFGPMILLALVLAANLTGVSVLSRFIMPVANPLFNLLMGKWL
jgi:Zn-dependent protease